MTVEEFMAISDRIEKVAASGITMGNRDADSVLNYDAMFALNEATARIMETKLVSLVLRSARIKDESEDLAVLARQVVEALHAAEAKVEQLQQSVDATTKLMETEAASYLAANMELRKRVEELEGRGEQQGKKAKSR